MDSRFFNRIYAKFFRTLRKIFLAGLADLPSTCPQDRFLGKQLPWKKNTFQILFRSLDGDFSGFRRKISNTVVRNALDSRFSIGLMPVFFGIHSKVYWLVCQNCTPRVHRIVFMRSIFFEKDTFPNVFQILGGNFSGFRQIFSSTVVRTAMAFRFLNRIYAFFSDLTQSFFGWSVRTVLYVSTGLFSWEAFFLKKTLFKL